jgi:hypothetical protein
MRPRIQAKASVRACEITDTHGGSGDAMHIHDFATDSNRSAI